MSEPKLISPLLDPFIMGDPMSDRGGIKACPAMKKDSEDKYIVKIISIPASPSQLEALLLSGAYSDKADALAYYESVANGILEETKILQRLSNLEGFFCYEDQQIEPMVDGCGFDVYLLSPYRKSLARYLSKNTMTHLGALNLGLDLCAALAVARQSGYLYVALKPENIYLTQDQGYRIGDIGFLKLDALKYASLPDRYRSAYTAPEIEDAYSSLNTTIDVYAAGLILYQAFNGGVLPQVDGQLPPPDYADYEIAEIILKACASDPKERWQDPIEMGQAIVSYMQRNGAHDTPIVPPIPPEAEQPQNEETDDESFEDEATGDIPEAETQTQTVCTEDSVHNEITETADVMTDSQAVEENTQSSTNESVFTEDDFGNLSFLEELSSDETLPGEDTADVDYDQISVEVSDILNQADDLISHPTPDPVIPPEAIEVTLPPEFTEAEPEQDQQDGPEDAVPEQEPQAEEIDEVKSCDADEVSNIEPEDSEETSHEEIPEDTEASGDTDATEEVPAAKPKSHWVRNTFIVLLILALLVGGYFFYKNFYLQLVDSISLEGSEDHLTVYVDSQINDELLSVICTDTYGIQTVQPVVDGKAVFTDLAPDSAYRVELAIKGFHKLKGETTTAYTTPVRTEIVQFGAVTGTEDGSAVIGFAIEGPDVDQWKLVYGVTGAEPREALFTGHMYTLTGLTVGTEYTFELYPATELYVTGNNKTTHVAKKLVRAEGLAVTSCADGKLEAGWSVPQDASVDSWTVHCYNDNGYDKTVVVDTNSVVLEDITTTDGYTLEVTAAGMSVSERVVIEKNSVTVKDFEAVQTEESTVKLSWGSLNTDGEAQVKICYQVDGSPIQEIVVEGGSNTALIYPLPGSKYTFTLQTASGNPILGGTAQLTTRDAEKFNAYKVSANRIDLRMCKTPRKQNWDRHDLSKSDYTTSFKSGEKASFLMHISGQYGISSDQVTIQFAIRDNNNNVVSIANQSKKWSSMWHKNYGEFNIPALPSAAGNYTVSVYFNGALVGEQAFTVKA
ncbi:MAG: hypothetical protein J6A74_05925 [Oscillospiraceae bacterium]|nr:hypothetical protein [Oscillospiraceae bacterium]